MSGKHRTSKSETGQQSSQTSAGGGSGASIGKGTTVATAKSAGTGGGKRGGGAGGRKTPTQAQQQTAGGLFTRVSGSERSQSNRGNRGNTKRARSNTSQTCLTQPVDDLDKEPWFHGLLTRDDVKPLLKEEGDFIIRASIEKDGVTQSVKISVLWRSEDRHFVVHRNKENTEFYVDRRLKFENIRDLVKYYEQTKEPLSSTKCDARLLNAITRLEWELDHEWITLGDKLGKGAFGEVFKAVLRYPNKKDPIEVAVKTGTGAANERQREEFLKEARLMRQYDHKNIVRIYGIAARKPPIYIVMELVPGGSLLTAVRKDNNIAVKEKMRYVLDIARGMDYLESRSCVHRDLAARNCLIGKNKEIKIADFGLSCIVTAGEGTGGEGGMGAGGGTGPRLPTRWTAPEVLLYLQFSSKSDVWSFGILVCEIFSGGKEPYTGKPTAEVKQGVVDGTLRCDIPDSTPEPLQDLVKRCWEVDPKERPTFTTIRIAIERIKL